MKGQLIDALANNIDEPASRSPRNRVGDLVSGAPGVVSTLIDTLQFHVDTYAWHMALVLVAVAVTAVAGWVLITPPTWVHVGTPIRAVLFAAALASGAGAVIALSTGNQKVPPAPVPTASPIAEPAVRRHEQWTLSADEAIDLDSQNPRWNATTHAWTTQDVAFHASGSGDSLKARNDQRAATLPPGTTGGFETCLRAPYRKASAAPRADNVNPSRAICLTTSEGRYALIEIRSHQPLELGVTITVWEKV